MVANNEHPRVIQHRLGHSDPTLSMGLYPMSPTTPTAPPPTTFSDSSLTLTKVG